MPQVAYVHIQALKRDAPIDKAIQLVGFDLCVKQTIAQCWLIYHASLAGYDCSITLQAGKVAPHGSCEYVACNFIASNVLNNAGVLIFWCGL